MLDLRDSTYFPRALDLAEVGYDEHDTMRFFTGPMTEPEQSIYRTMRSDKKIHWCFLGERIESPVKKPGVMSIIGGSTPLSALPNIRHSNDRRSLRSQILPRFKMGYTIAAMYAQRTGGLNLCVEDVSMVTIFPCGLNDLHILADKVQATLPTTCVAEACENPASRVCSVCKLGPYCSTNCQKDHWKSAHKHECSSARQLREWASFDWSFYDRDRLSMVM
ncbi:hypothetical protein C8F04DRAFT_259590 [Mycena alexandri]|uniref:MYND-type domain-containing protein n=1 Tax=Mycena alexandri TaxID=1745969 RepID=A0AAD6WQW4_9AGAR|nr:hypothetical protein C8F04DRAFT_259590 [Mycena alexandri]